MQRQIVFVNKVGDETMLQWRAVRSFHRGEVLLPCSWLLLERDFAIQASVSKAA
jgi:hypothetical protein